MSSLDGASLIPVGDGEQRAQYRWPLPMAAWLPCMAAAGYSPPSHETIEVWHALADEHAARAALNAVPGLEHVRFVFRSLSEGIPQGIGQQASPTHSTQLESDPATAVLALIYAVRLLKQTGRAVCVDGFVHTHAEGAATLSLAAEVVLADTSAVLRSWAYRAGVAKPGQPDAALENGDADDPVNVGLHGEAADSGRAGDPAENRMSGTLPAMPYRASAVTIGTSDSTGQIPDAAHVFARESFIDELAEHHRLDPLALRLDLLDPVESSGAVALISTLAERASWQGRQGDRSKAERRDPRTIGGVDSGVLKGRGAAFNSTATSRGPDTLDTLDTSNTSNTSNTPGASSLSSAADGSKESAGRDSAASSMSSAAYSAWIVDLNVDAVTGDVDIRRVVAGKATGRPGLNHHDVVDGIGAARIAAATSRLLGRNMQATPTFDETATGAISHDVVIRGGAVQPAVTATVTLPHKADAPEARGQTEFELDTSTAAAAIANALFDATGVRFREPPFTPERIRQSLSGATALPGSGGTGSTRSDAGLHDEPDEAPRPEARASRNARDIRRPSRRSWWGALVAGGVGGAIGLASLWPSRAPIAPIEPPLASTWSEATLARGRNLATISDCAVCHTAPGGVTNAGGLGLETPFGVIYSTNLTPDRETGIGGWSFEAFNRAMRQGISRDGKHLYPAFPYTAFSKFSEADMTALYAYLMSQPAVKSTPPETRLPFPLNQRGLMAGWNALYLKQGEYQPDPARSAEWNRGKYLVEGAGHCSACHSPRNAAGAEQGGKAYLTGGEADGWLAPALKGTSASPVPWTEGALYRYLRTGFSPEHGVAAGPMAPVVTSLAEAPDSDVRAMAHYLASLNETVPEAVSQTRALQAEEDAIVIHGLDNGKRIFATACAVCHAENSGVGNFGVRPLMQLNTSVAAATPDNLLHVILHGIDTPATEGLGYMPGFRDALDDRQIAEVSAYLRARFAPGKPPWKNLEQASAKIRN
jgi:nicotinate dehydrogenase subunit B